MEDYASVLNREHFSESAQYFCFPVIVTYNGHTVVVNNSETFAKMNQSMLDELKSHNYKRTQIVDGVIRASADDCVEFEAQFDLLDGDGQLIRSPTNILTIKHKDGEWLISSIVGTSSEYYDIDISA